MAELQTHPELDTDGDGVLSEGEAQVPQHAPRPGGIRTKEGAGQRAALLTLGQGCWGTRP